MGFGVLFAQRGCLRALFISSCGFLILANSWLVARTPDATNVFGLPADAIAGGGSIVMVGGGDTPDDVVDEFLRRAGGISGRIVVIPSAHDYPDMESVETELAHWRDYDVDSLDFLHAMDRSDADSKSFVKALETATGVFMTGGAQERLANLYANTRVETLLQEVLERGGIVGGTSAGASALSNLMIKEGTPTNAVTARGLNMAEWLVIDQHFTQRGRLPRLVGVLEDNLEMLGIGVDEETAVFLKGNELQVMGVGEAALVLGPNKKTDGTTIYKLKTGETADVRLVTSASGDISYELDR